MWWLRTHVSGRPVGVTCRQNVLGRGMSGGESRGTECTYDDKDDEDGDEGDHV